jgi:heavy metal translocating P-type ATPase
MLKKIKNFFKDYLEVGLALIVFVVSGILYLVDQQTIANIMLGTASVIAIIPLLIGMVETIRKGSYGVDILAITAILTAVALGEYWAAIIIVLMLTGGEALEDYAENRAKVELSELIKKRPQKANLIKGDKAKTVNAKDVKVGDKIKILLGEIVPVDCEIIEGESLFDESSLTGESLPAERAPGDQLLSGSINTAAVVIAQATSTSKDSQYEQIIKLVTQAASSQAPFVRMADRYAVPFTAFAFIIAGGAWFLSGEVMRFLQVLVVATPCPLLLGAPIAFISGMSRSAKHGIIVKNGSTIERLAGIQTMAFDKTGTLTQGKPSVSKIKAFGDFDENQVLTYAAMLEQNSSHILASSITERAKDKGIKIPHAKKVKESAGLGLSGTYKGKQVAIGNAKILNDVEELPKGFTQTSAETTAYLTVNNKLVGYITFTDEIRDNAKEMLNQVSQLGVRHSLMVTGDSREVAQAVSKKLGIEEVKANCLPGDKIIAIENADYKPVGFVGDGVNDAPVLTAADVGIALGARGSTVASESADVVIMQDNVTKVSESIEIAQRTLFIAKQSVLIGIFISVGLMLIFSTGRFSAVQGALVQEVVDVVVIINALRAHSSGRKRPYIKRT